MISYNLYFFKERVDIYIKFPYNSCYSIGYTFQNTLYIAEEKETNQKT